MWHNKLITVSVTQNCEVYAAKPHCAAYNDSYGTSYKQPLIV